MSNFFNSKNNQWIVLTSFRSSSRCSHSFLGILKLVQLLLSFSFSSSPLFLLMAKSFCAAMVLVSSFLSFLSFCFYLLMDATKHYVCPRIRSSVYISPHVARSWTMGAHHLLFITTPWFSLSCLQLIPDYFSCSSHGLLQWDHLVLPMYLSSRTPTMLPAVDTGSVTALPLLPAGFYVLCFTKNCCETPSLCSPGLPGTHGSPPASASQELPQPSYIPKS